MGFLFFRWGGFTFKWRVPHGGASVLVGGFSKKIIRCGVPPPGMIISDNGGEFNNSLFTNMAEMFNINIKLTAAESPWSNDIIEQHNTILAKVKFKKIDENT